MKVKSILVSQPKPQDGKSPFLDIAKQYGVRVDFHQFIRTEVLSAREFRLQHINILDYTAIMFSSRHGIDFFFNLCEQLRVVVPETMYYYCISEQIANYLQKYVQYRKRKVFFSNGKDWQGVISSMQRHKDFNFLMIMSDKHNNDALDFFAENGLTVQPAIMYRTVQNDLPKGSFRNYDMFVLYNPTGVRAFKHSYPRFKQGERVLACWGVSTAKTMEELGLRVDIQAPSEQNRSITEAIQTFMAENQAQ